MKLAKKIHLHKVNKLEQLTPLELDQLGQDAGAKLAINENQALAELAALEFAPPSREAMLAGASAAKEQNAWTSGAPKLPWWSSRHTLRWAVSSALVMVVAGVLVITPSPTNDGNGTPGFSSAQPAWAAEPGLVMAYDTGTDNEEEALHLAQELTEKAHAFFLLQAEDLSIQEVLLNDAAKALQKQRTLLGSTSAKHSEKLVLNEAERASLKELHIQFLEVHKALELHTGELEQISQELALQEVEVAQKLSDLHSLRGKLSKLRRFAPKHEVKRLDNGLFSITVGFPGVELEPAPLALSLSAVVEHQVSVSPAMFFVQKPRRTGKRGLKIRERVRSPFVSQPAPAGTGGQLAGEAHGVLLPKLAPSIDTVRLGLAKSAFFRDAGSELLVSSDTVGGKLVATILKDGKLVHQIESKELGEGMLWFGVPQLIKLHTTHPNLEAELGLAGRTGMFSFNNEDHEVVLGQAGGSWMEPSTGAKGHPVWIAPGIIKPGDLGDLQAILISILGEVLEGQELEVLTTVEDGVHIIQIIVNGEVSKEIRIKDGDCKVVVVADESAEKDSVGTGQK